MDVRLVRHGKRPVSSDKNCRYGSSCLAAQIVDQRNAIFPVEVEIRKDHVNPPARAVIGPKRVGLSFTTAKGAAGSPATLTIAGKTIEGFSPFTWSQALIDAGYPLLKSAPSTIALNKEQSDQVAALQVEKKTADVIKILSDARIAADPAAKKIAAIANVDGVVATADGSGATATVTEIAAGSADKAKINWPMAIGILFIMMIYVTMVYGPIAAFLVELFPTRIRYTSMSLPYHIGNGWFGGMLPLLATAIVASYGNIYAGLWYPIVVALITAVIGFFFLKETKDVNISA